MGKFLTFKTLISKNGIHPCLETKIGKIIALKELICLNALTSPNKIVLTYVIRLVDNVDELLKALPTHPFPKKEIFPK